jgi:hypothetical protein
MTDHPIDRALGPPGGGVAEITCEMCFDLLDEYVELEAAGRDADAAIPGMREHLDGCPACREDHESLLALVESDEQAAS